MKLHRLIYFPIFLISFFCSSALLAHIYDSLDASILQVAQFSGIQATVSSVSADNADFLTLKLAIDAGFNAIRVIGDTTETAVATLQDDLDYLIVIDANVILDFVGFNLLYAATGAGGFEQRLFMRGQGKIEYTFTSINNRLFKRNGRDVILDVNGLTIQNDSTADDCSVSDADVIIMENIFFDLPAQDKGGITTSSDTRNRIDSLTFFGGTSLTSRALSIPENGFYINLTFLDTYNGTAGFPCLEVTTASKGTIMENINITDADVSTGNLVMVFKGRLKNFMDDSSTFVIIQIGDSTQISNFYGVNTSIDFGSSNECMLSNVKLVCLNPVFPSGDIDLSDISANVNFLSNVTFASVTSIAGQQNRFVNCSILADGDILISGDRNNFSNCQIGTQGTGGTEGIIITATADITSITGCQTDIAISDSGTNSSFANNVIY